MTTSNLAPAPTPSTPFTDPSWQRWILALTNAVGTAASSASWTSIDFTGSSLTSILDRQHSELTSLQGGTAGQYYHLTLAQWTGIANFSSTIVPYVDATGTVDAIVLAYTPAITSVPDGMMLQFGALGANTIAAVTVAINAIAAAPVVKMNGAPLLAGDIAGAACQCLIIYNLGSGSWNLVNPTYPIKQATTALAPAYVKGGFYFDTTLNKLRIGGATAWETVTSV